MNNTQISELGCTHYRRKVRFITPCCKEIYTCRFCHNENESHELDRHGIRELICSHCATIQRVRTTCQKCGIRFGEYTCLICNLFDNEDKGQFHCTGCGLCRTGGERNYIHCDRCNMCLHITTITSHKCVDDATKRNCPICLDDDMHSSRQVLYAPKCGHYLHMQCWENLKTAGHTRCPICQAIIT